MQIRMMRLFHYNIKLVMLCVPATILLLYNQPHIGNLWFDRTVCCKFWLLCVPISAINKYVSTSLPKIIPFFSKISYPKAYFIFVPKYYIENIWIMLKNMRNNKNNNYFLF